MTSLTTHTEFNKLTEKILIHSFYIRDVCAFRGVKIFDIDMFGLTGFVDFRRFRLHCKRRFDMGLFDIFFRKDSGMKHDKWTDQNLSLNTDAMRYSEEGFRRYFQKDFYKAALSFTNAISSQPNSHNFYRLRGSCYDELKNDANAEEDYSRALNLCPEDYIAAYRLGMLYFRRRNLEGAAKWLKASFHHCTETEIDLTVIGKNNLMYLGKQVIAGNLGNLLIQAGKIDEGIYYLDHAIRYDPSYANPYFTKGMALAQKGKPEEGMRYLEEAVKLNLPGAAEGLITLKTFAQHKISLDETDVEPTLDFVFHSSDHLRYEKGILVSGPHGSSQRAIKVEKNINGGEGFTVQIFNTQVDPAILQMSPKQMKIISIDANKIALAGFGEDFLGYSFSDYGLTAYHNSGQIAKVVFHMYDREVCIEYLPL